MLYIRLFHGRDDPCQSMDDWGTDGPVFGPYEFVHTTYTTEVKLGDGKKDCCDILFFFEDMLFYGGVYYGDWSVFTEEVFTQGKCQTTSFEQSKANLPTSIQNAETVT